MMLVRLMYASRATAPVDHETLQAILRQSHAHNAAHGITGLLCCSGSIYIQALEGGRQAVNALYQRIAGDSRHSEVTLLSYEEIGERRFAGWAMGQVNTSRLNPALLLKYSATAVLDPFAVSGRFAQALFDELVATASIVSDRN